MNILDIIIALVLISAAIGGFRRGIISQLFGIAAIILGVWLSFKFSSQVGKWIGVELSDTLSFIIVLIVAIWAIVLVGKITSKTFSLTGLGIIDRIGGLALGVVKYGLILSLLLGLFININKNFKMMKPEKIEKSILLAPLQDMSNLIFPYLIKAKDAILENEDVQDMIDKVKPEEEEGQEQEQEHPTA